MLLKIRNISSSKHKLDKYIFILIYFSSINIINHFDYAHIYGKLYLIEGLKANLLVGNNILAIKKIFINLANKMAIISYC